MPNFVNIYLPKNVIHKQSCRNLCTQNHVLIFNTERKYTDVVLWVQLHTLAYERGCILHSVPSVTPIDVESLSELDRASEQICHNFHNQDRKLHFTLQGIATISRFKDSLRVSRKIESKVRNSAGTVCI